MNLVGDDSEVVADVALQVAAAETPAAAPADDADAVALVPLVAAAGALVATVAGFVRVASRRRGAGGSTARDRLRSLPALAEGVEEHRLQVLLVDGGVGRAAGCLGDPLQRGAGRRRDRARSR